MGLQTGGHVAAHRKQHIAASMERLGYDLRSSRDCRLWIRREGATFDRTPIGADDRTWLLGQARGPRSPLRAARDCVFSALTALLVFPLLALSDARRHAFWSVRQARTGPGERLLAWLSGRFQPADMARVLFSNAGAGEVLAFVRGIGAARRGRYLARLAAERPGVVLRVLEHGRPRPDRSARDALEALLVSGDRTQRERAILLLRPGPSPTPPIDRD